MNNVIKKFLVKIKYSEALQKKIKVLSSKNMALVHNGLIFNFTFNIKIQIKTYPQKSFENEQFLDYLNYVHEGLILYTF